MGLQYYSHDAPRRCGYNAMLLRMVQSGRLDARKLVSHRFKLPDIMKAYDTFANAAKQHAVKVVITNACAGGGAVKENP